MTMTNILPDPNNPIDATGAANPAGDAGPGYATVGVRSVSPIMKNRSNSGRVSTSAIAHQYWEVDIAYNPMTRDEFDIIHAFIESKKGGLIPFFVSLPQYFEPKDSLLVSDPAIDASYPAGSSVIGYTSGAGDPTRGDLFTISDPTDSAHTKAYKVLGVDAGSIEISPGLVRNVDSTATLIFIDPKFRVTLSGSVQEYRLGNSNLYEYSLKLEEAMI